MSETEPPGPSAEVQIRVRYAETDQMGVVHHANYLVWFELARSEFCRAHGIDYRQMEADGLILPVVEARVRYVSPARYEDEVIVRATVIEVRRSTLRIAYQARRGDDILATGETLQILIEKQSNRPRMFRKEIAGRFSGQV